MVTVDTSSRRIDQIPRKRIHQIDLNLLNRHFLFFHRSGKIMADEIDFILKIRHDFVIELIHSLLLTQTNHQDKDKVVPDLLGGQLRIADVFCLQADAGVLSLDHVFVVVEDITCEEY